MYNNIYSKDIKGLIGTINIIDIRENYIYRLGYIPTAKNIPMNFLLLNPNTYLDKSKKYYIYCDYGVSSKKVCDVLSKEGYNVINLIGGYKDYINNNT